MYRERKKFAILTLIIIHPHGCKCLGHFFLNFGPSFHIFPQHSHSRQGSGGNLLVGTDPSMPHDLFNVHPLNWIRFQ